MRVLLDMHILLWWLAAAPAAPRRAAEVISDTDTSVLVPAATSWEIAIMKSAGRLDAPDDLLAALDANEFESIAITATHAVAAGQLPLHHRVDRRFSDCDVELLPLG